MYLYSCEQVSRQGVFVLSSPIESHLKHTHTHTQRYLGWHLAHHASSWRRRARCAGEAPLATPLPRTSTGARYHGVGGTEVPNGQEASRIVARGRGCCLSPVGSWPAVRVASLGPCWCIISARSALLEWGGGCPATATGGSMHAIAYRAVGPCVCRGFVPRVCWSGSSFAALVACCALLGRGASPRTPIIWSCRVGMRSSVERFDM